MPAVTKSRRRPTYGRKRHVMPSGYIRVWEPGHPCADGHGYVYEHRKVVFDAGIELLAGSHVHHINHDKADNRLSNLEVKNASDHARDHIAETGTVKNQYGVWTVDETARKERQRLRSKVGRERRFQRLKADPDLRPHGSLNTYTNWGCRCAPCRQAFNGSRPSRRAL